MSILSEIMITTWKRIHSDVVCHEAIAKFDLSRPLSIWALCVKIFVQHMTLSVTWLDVVTKKSCTPPRELSMVHVLSTETCVRLCVGVAFVRAKERKIRGRAHRTNVQVKTCV